jgi:hypothetical protein
MDIVNKSAILISWPRELDMFSVFTERFLDDTVIIVDDFIYTDSEKFENGKSIVKLLDGKVEYVLLSEILGKVKYKLIFSTGGQTFQEKITYISYIKYLYAISIGSLIEYFKLPGVFLKIVGRPLTAGGKFAKKFGKYPIEKIVGETVVKYPKGLDINKDRYPEDQWKDIFDIYLCHSDIDYNLIVDKFPGVKCIKIGYPRYDNTPNIKDAKKIIFYEIKGMEIEKPLILWMPTIIRVKGELIDNIIIWADIVKSLLDKYNVLISIHPKLAVVCPEIVGHLANIGFTVDATKGRNLATLYQSADLVLADYGGPVFSTVYMKKKLILINSPNKKYIQWRSERMYIDDDIRNDVESFNVDDGTSLIEKIDNDIKNINNLKENELKNKYFGDDCNYKNLQKIFSKLVE